LLELGTLYFGNYEKEKGKVVSEGYGNLKGSVNGEYVEKGLWIDDIFIALTRYDRD